MTTADSVSGGDILLTSPAFPASSLASPGGAATATALAEAPVSDRLARFSYPESCYLPVRVPCDWPGCHNVFVADHPETRAAEARRVAVAREGWHYMWTPGTLPPPFLCPLPHYLHPDIPPPVTIPGSEHH